mgnify:CR=1 FL=1
MLRKQTFWGGVHPAGRKELSSGAPLEDCPPPREVVIPLLQHIGKPCTPLVKAGDHVDMGQKIGDGEGLCVPVHASVSGTVKAVEPRSHPSGQPHLAVVIENDFQNTYHSAVPPCADTDALDADALIRRIREAGLVGMGGATFPTDIKANIGKVETLIANACECEPYITADLRLLQERGEPILKGTRALAKVLGVDRVVLAAESDMLTAVEALERRISRKRSRVELKTIRTRYPMGAEKQIVQSVTRREVPPGGRAEDVRCVVFNVSAAFAVGEALNKGLPLTHRAVTVTGGAVARPRNLWVPLGTPLKELVSSAGGFREEPGLILVGGPMTGVTQKSLEAPVLPNTNGLLCLAPWEQPREQAPTVCIRCGQCVSVCPMHLSPIFVVRALKENAAERLRSLHPQDCMDCGCCTYICPAHIPLADLVRQAAGQVRELEKGGDLHG